MKLSFLAIVAILTSLAPARAQTSPVRAVPRTFEVASIHPDRTGSDARRAGTSPGGIFTAANVTLKLLISRAFGVPEAQIKGGPGWLDTEKYSISARADTPLEMSREELRPCLQALLAERFQLKVHQETRQGSVFLLTIAGKGTKLTAHTGEGASGIAASTESGRATITGRKVPVARLAEYLSSQAQMPVIDNTGLKADYDFKLEWSPDQGTESTGPSIFTALEEQLGLKVTSAKGPIPTIVVDAAKKASEN